MCVCVCTRVYWPTFFSFREACLFTERLYDEGGLVGELRQSRNTDKILFCYLASLVTLRQGLLQFVCSQLFCPELTLGSSGSIHFVFKMIV